MTKGTYKRLAVTAIILAHCAAAHLGCAQLAITEVMSQSVTNVPDYWELTNFGDTPINLTGYRVADRNGSDRTAFNNLTNYPHESIVFLLLNQGQTYTNFSNMWGTAFSGRVIEQIAGFGISTAGEPLSLWDSQGRLVDSIEVPFLPTGSRGVSFSFGPSTGKFGWLSQAGECGAFKAANSDDIGSPGRHDCGPVELGMLKDLASQTNDAGDSVKLTVDVAGLPRPGFRWFFESEPLPDGTNAALTIADATPQHQGRYYVVATNFQGVVTSSVAMLTVNTTRTCVSIISLSSPPVLFEGQTATFTVESRGYPRRFYQWQHEGIDILGATGSTYTIPSVYLGDAGLYSVHVSNEVCVASTAAVLQVTNRPDLRITEVMIDASTNSPGNDYWELTSYESNVVDITQYKFLDNENVILALEITNRTLIRPGESVIFSDTLTRDEFVRWWGATNLPPNLQVVTYRGVGLGPHQHLILWNEGATQNYDFLTNAAWGSNQCPGVSFRYPRGPRYEECCIEGLAGAFRSALGNNIGSPGYDAMPRILSATVASDEVRLRCLGDPGASYELQYNSFVSRQDWSTAGAITAPGSVFVMTNRVSPQTGARFYRLRQ